MMTTATRVVRRYLAAVGASKRVLDKRKRLEDEAASRWENGGRKNFVAWVQRQFLPVFKRCLDQRGTMAGEMFGEDIFQDLHEYIIKSPEIADLSKHFGYPGNPTDLEILSWFTQDLSSIRMRLNTHFRSGGRKIPTGFDIYDREYDTMSRAAQMLLASERRG